MMETSGEMTFPHPHLPNTRIVSEIVPEKGPLLPNGNAPTESTLMPESDGTLPESDPLPGFRNQRSVNEANEGNNYHSNYYYSCTPETSTVKVVVLQGVN